MRYNRLRVYYGPEDSEATVDDRPEQGKNTVSVPLSKILPLLVDAAHSERTWLGDFEDDEVTLSSDLYEVLLAYQFCRRPSA